MSHSSGMNQVGTPRILACPDCQRLQYVLPGLGRSNVACKECRRLFRVTGAGGTLAASRINQPVDPATRPSNRYFNNRWDASTDEAEAGESIPAPRSGRRLRRRLGRLHPRAVASFVLAAVVGAVLGLTTMADFRQPSVPRPPD